MFDSLTRLPAQQLAGDIVLALLMCWFIICVLMTAATHITTGRKNRRVNTPAKSPLVVPVAATTASEPEG